MKVKVVKEASTRKISKDISESLISSVSAMLTPKWEQGETPLKRSLKYDVAQAWVNNIVKKQLASEGFDDEVDPFSKERPKSVHKRPKGGSNQAIDFQKRCSSGKRHVIEVECGNVGSLYRSIHKICISLRENEETVGIVMVPDKELIGRCDGVSAMSHSESAKIILSEYSFYHLEANQINLIEFSSDEEINIAELNDDRSFWKGNWSNEMEEYLDGNLNRFLKPITE